MFALAACGGQRSELLLEQGATADSGAAASLSGGLPDLGQLPAPHRELSIIGPGFFALPLDEMVAREGVTGAPGSLTVDGGASMGFVVYGVFGFDATGRLQRGFTANSSAASTTSHSAIT
jgi:hypothetical protein